MRTWSYFKHGTGDQVGSRICLEGGGLGADHGEHRTRAYNGGLGESCQQSPQSRANVGEIGGGAKFLEVESFLSMFSYKRGAKREDLSDSSAPCNVTQFF